MTSSPKHGRRLRAAAAGIALLAAVGVAGCSGGGNKTASSSAANGGLSRSDAQTGSNGAAAKAAAPAAPDKGSLPNQAQSGAGTAAGGNPAKVPVLPAVSQRSIVHTGDITVRVPDVNRAAAQAEALAAGAGGYLSGDDRQIDAAQSTATLTLRVSADRFDATLNAIALLGKEQSRNVSTQDVTSQVIDVAARLTSQRASVARIQTLLAKATTIGEIVSIESELTQREADLESLEAQQAKLGDLTTLSTITVLLLGPQAQLVVPPKTDHRSGFVAGLSRGWHTFLASMAWLLTVLGAILPFAVGIAFVAWLVRLLVRRLQARRTPPAVEAPAPPASAAG
jgi:Domain of unknown function (DUF4349)